MIRYQVKEGYAVKVEDRLYTEGEVIEFDIDENEDAEMEALREFLAPQMRKLEPLEDAPSRPPIGYTTREMEPEAPRQVEPEAPSQVEPEAPRQVESDPSSDIELGDFTD